jgi:5-formyltetrahydrofolate cyclo-ligase
MLADKLPSEVYDIKVDYILTENGFIKAIEED